jgi:hypothetical protein
MASSFGVRVMPLSLPILLNFEVLVTYSNLMTTLITQVSVNATERGVFVGETVNILFTLLNDPFYLIIDEILLF